MSDTEGPSTPTVRTVPPYRRRREPKPLPSGPSSSQQAEGKDPVLRPEDKEDAPLLSAPRDAKGDDGENDAKENERPVVNEAYSGNSSSGAGAGASPKRPDKPARPQRTDSSYNNNNNNNANSNIKNTAAIDANDEAARLARLDNSPLHTTWFTFLKSTLCCKMGYRMEPYYRSIAPVSQYSVVQAQGQMLACVVENVLAGAAFVTGLVRPKVRVHCVYIDSGFYIKGVGMPPAPPCLTGPCPLTQPSAMPYWRETLPISAPFTEAVSPNTLLLFELLDDRPSLKPNKSGTKHRAHKRIAWSYLLPVGSRGQLNVGIRPEWALDASSSGRSGDTSAGRGRGRGAGSSEASAITPRHDEDNIPPPPPPADLSVQLQLFSYTSNDGVLGGLQRHLMGWPPLVPDKNTEHSAYPDMIPPVYVQYRMQKLQPIPGALLGVSLGPRPLEVVSPSDMSGLGIALPSQLLVDGVTAKKRPTTHNLSKTELNRAKTATIKRSRTGKEPCILPDRLLHRLECGPEGAMCVTFSNSGHLLAVAAKTAQVILPFAGPGTASPHPGNIYSLRLFDTDTGTEVWSDTNAHCGVIYGLKWSLDDTYLLTSSGDGTARVYDVFGLSPMARASAASPLAAVGSPGGNSVSGASVSSPVRRSLEGGEDMQSQATLRPFLLHTLRPAFAPLSYTYCAIFQEYSLAVFGAPAGAQDEDLSRSPLPRILTGSADGCIRVYDGSRLQGYVTVDASGHLSAQEAAQSKETPPTPLPAHTDSDGRPARVQAMVIDERSRYLLSGDSNHEIYAWKKDADGWYCLQRRFKKDPNLADLGPLGGGGGGGAGGGSGGASSGASLKSGLGITSLTMHPDKTRSQLLVLSHTVAGPALRMLSTSTYKTTAVYGTAGTTGVFSRATLSADGRYALCGSCLDASGTRCSLRVWEAATALTTTCPLTSITLPYHLRCASWHPRQHMVAIAMAGPGAAVVIYTAERESATRAVAQLYNVSSLGLGYASNVPESSETDSLAGTALGASGPVVDKLEPSSGGLTTSSVKNNVSRLIASRRQEIAQKAQGV